MTDCDDKCIQYGSKVILMKENNIQIAQIVKGKKINVDKQWFNLCGAVGHPYGTTFEAKGNNIFPVIEATELHNVKGDDGAKMRDNRHIRDTSDSQKLSRENIEELRSQGEKGEEVVRQLIENSSTFNEKTTYSKEKYIKKKTKKHVNRFTIIRPCTRLIAEMYFNRGPVRINNLRIDALAQMLTFGDVKGHNRQLVVESCNGLLLAATMDRMGGHGLIVQLHAEQDPPRQALEGYDFTPGHYETLHNYPLRMLGAIPSTEKAPEADQIEVKLEPAPSKRARLDVPEVEMSEPNGVNSDNSAAPEKATATMEKKTCLEENERNDVNANTTGDASLLSDTPDKPDRDVLSETTKLDKSPSSPKVKCSDETQSDTGVTKDLSATEGIEAVSKVKDAARKAAKAEQERKKENRQKQLQATQEILEEGRFDSLLVATRVHPTPIVVRLLDFLSDSRPVVVFCPYQEPLMDCYQRLRDSGHVVHLRLSETWLRNYQVLPNRTHPEINMSMNGGYLLTFIKVSNQPALSSSA